MLAYSASLDFSPPLKTAHRGASLELPGAVFSASDSEADKSTSEQSRSRSRQDYFGGWHFFTPAVKVLSSSSSAAAFSVVRLWVCGSQAFHSE